MKESIEKEGRLWARAALNTHDLELLEKALGSQTGAGSRLDWSDALIDAAGVSSKLNDLARRVLVGAKPVRFIFFNKTPDVNWSLPWHQDRVIAVENKTEAKGFNHWSQKAGTWHCEPPVEVLENMIFVRVHLDDTNEVNGSLEISIGSHKFGKILSGDIENTVARLPKEMCSSKRGDVLFVKALTLHRSMVSRSSAPRRALRIDYANHDLPHPMVWKY